MRFAGLSVLLSLLAPAAALAQESSVAAPCSRPEVPASARPFCVTVAQAVESAQPQIGILVTGGNPTPGSASSGGLRLGVIPGLSLTAKVNLVMARFPNVVQERGSSGQRTEEREIPAPAVAGTASLGIFPGFSIAPGLGGIGAVDVLGAVSWLPIEASQLGGFQENSATTSYGVGGRLGLLKESFTTPGLSVSLMYHQLGTIGYGNVCDSPVLSRTDAQTGYTLETGGCTSGGHPGEFAFDLTDLSARAQISKHFLVFGLAAGVGYDQWNSTIGYGFRSACPLVGVQNCYVRVRDAELDNDRWSAFANASIGGLLGSLVFEAGWLQGAEPISGFDAAQNAFDPRKGTLFGSAGLRLTF